jgi:hypothetical protein
VESSLPKDVVRIEELKLKIAKELKDFLDRPLNTTELGSDALQLLFYGILTAG